MKKTILNFLAISILLNLLVSCSVTKRQHLSGYNIEWYKQKKDLSNTKLVLESKKIKSDSIFNLPIYEYTNEVKGSMLLVSSNSSLKGDLNSITKIQRSVFLNNHEVCDLIIMKDGQEIKCKVSEIGVNEIKYKKCDNLNGPIYYISKSELLLIQYANGSKDIIKSNEQKQTGTSSSSDNSNIKNHPLAIASFVCSLLGWLLLGIGTILGIIFGAIALKKIKEDPTKFKGRGFALAGLIIGLAVMLIVLLVLIF